MTSENLEKEIAELLKTCRTGVLSTCGQGSPYASLVGFIYQEENHSIIFATPASGRKYDNLKELPSAAMLISQTAGTDSDFFGASALTVTGRCKEIADKEKVIASYIGRFPELESFVRNPGTAVFGLEAELFRLVNRFQEVRELRIR